MFGLFGYLVMLVKLTNACATSNKMMDDQVILHTAYTRVFFDEVIVYSKSI